jgi:fibronectin type 3 domain-containing protein
VPASAPTLLGAAADQAAVLSWTVPANDGGSPITGYRVFRRIGTDPETLRATTGAAETTYIDSGLTNGLQYAYRVAAVTAAGQGAFSNTVTVVPAPSATAPSAPLGLTATKASRSSAVILAWSPPANDGGSPITNYFIYRKGPNETAYSPIGITSGSTRTYTDSSTVKRTQYQYYVTAVNAYGVGPPSNVVSIRTR